MARVTPTQWPRRWAWSFAVLLILVVGSHAHAAVSQGQWSGEIFGGNYGPGPDDVLDDEGTFGLRVITMVSPRWAVVGSASTVNFEDTVMDGTTTVNFDTDVLLLDFSAGYVFFPDKRVSIALGAGIGGSFSSTDGTFTSPTLQVVFEELDESSLTLNAAAGPVIQLSRRIYLKPLVRIRWFENREDDETDLESSLAFGFKFGGGQ